MAPSATPEPATLYPPLHVWDTLSQDQRDSFLAGVVGSLQTSEPRRKRSRVDLSRDEDNEDDGKVPPAVVPILPKFPGITYNAIVAIYNYSFWPKKDLIKLRSPKYKVNALHDKSYKYKNTISSL